MELSKSYNICTDYKDRTRQNWDMLQFVEVIFVDQTHPANKPMLYQLSNNKLSLEQILNLSKSGAFYFSRDSFVLVGEIQFIDKKKKHVTLSDKNIIAYNHLVIASGKKPVLSFIDNELMAALQALTDALRVKPKIPDSFPSCLKSPSKQTVPKKEPSIAMSDKATGTSDQQDIRKIVQPYIAASEAKFKSFGIDTSNTRIYEVQI